MFFMYAWSEKIDRKKKNVFFFKLCFDRWRHERPETYCVY